MGHPVAGDIKAHKRQCDELQLTAEGQWQRRGVSGRVELNWHCCGPEGEISSSPVPYSNENEEIMKWEPDHFGHFLAVLAIFLDQHSATFGRLLNVHTCVNLINWVIFVTIFGGLLAILRQFWHSQPFFWWCEQITKSLSGTWKHKKSDFKWLISFTNANN